MDFTRCSQIATKTIELSEGPLPQFPFSNEYQLRQLGLPTKLEKGVIEIMFLAYREFLIPNLLVHISTALLFQVLLN